MHIREAYNLASRDMDETVLILSPEIINKRIWIERLAFALFDAYHSFERGETIAGSDERQRKGFARVRIEICKLAIIYGISAGAMQNSLARLDRPSPVEPYDLPGDAQDYIGTGIADLLGEIAYEMKKFRPNRTIIRRAELFARMFQYANLIAEEGPFIRLKSAS